MADKSEKTPLLRSGSGAPSSFYFVRRTPSTAHQDPDALASINGTVSSDKAPRPAGGSSAAAGGLVEKVLEHVNQDSSQVPKKGRDELKPALHKPRKVPVKVEPKVFFSNERTFIAWMHMAVTLSTISLAIVALANPSDWSQYYGLIIMPVAILFILYALYMYMKRASMIRRREPGPYEDTVGPVFLATVLMVSIILNFVVKMYDIYG